MWSVLLIRGQHSQHLPNNSPQDSNMASSVPVTGAARLRQLLSDSGEIIVCPGVFDGLTARVALKSGAQALYMVKSALGPRSFIDS